MKTKRILSLFLTLVMICGLLPMNIFKAEAATPASGTLLNLSNYGGYPDQVNHTFKIRIKTTNDCDASAGNCEASWISIYGPDNGDIYLNKSLMHNEGNTLEVTYTSHIYPYAAQLALAEDIMSSRDYACDVTLFCDGEEIDTVNLYAKGGSGFSDSTMLYFTESRTSFPSISDGLIVPSSTNLTASGNSTVNNSISFYAKTKDGADAYEQKIINVKSGNVTAYCLGGMVPASSVKLVNTSNQAVTFPGISVNTSYKRVEVGPEFISGYNGTSATFKVSAQVGMHSNSYFWGGLKTIYSSPITVTKPTYTVYFDKNGGEGGSMAPQTLYYGNDSNKANLSANVFTKTGYTFDGWSLNANGSGTRYADKASVLNLTTDSSVTLYAQWKLNEYSVSYEKNKPAATSNQVTGTMANSSHTYSVAKNISANQYSLTGYTFNGWNTIANGGGTAYANSASVINLTTVNGATVPFYAQWLVHTYTVAYNQNKPANASTTVTGTTENSSHIYDVAKNITPNEYALTGYTFKGWNTASNGSGTSYANNASVKNLTATDGATVTLYAKWDANEYDITFHEEGGSTVSDQTVVFDSTANNEVAVPNREGYTFNGWFTQQSGGIMVYNADGACAKNTAYWDVNGKWINPDDVILYAQWTANTYTLTYDTKGGSPLEDQTVTFDSPYIGESPERVGYIFVRWFKDTAYTQPITIGSTLVKTAADHSIYAKWNPITYKIYYADGTNTVKVQNAKYGEAYNLPLASTLNLTPPANHHFVGWNNLSADATTVTYADGQRITTGLTTINNDSVNLFAVWAPNDTYRVVYDPNGGSGSPKDNNSYYEGNTVSINFATPTRPGYQFSGWSKEADTAVPIYTQTGTTSFEMGDENVTLYAVWKPIGYTVKYHTGTAETISDTECTYDVEAVLNDGSTLTKDDYTFKGWAISQDSNVVTYAPGAKVLNLSNINGAEIDLYAVWQEDGKIRLSYNANGGYGAPEYQENYLGKVLYVSNIVPVRENYTFLGWDEDAEATSATYQASDSFTLGSSNTVLYAVWKKNPSLTYHANGGLFEEAIATSYPVSGSDVVFASVKPVRSGYTFLGWNTDKTATSALTSLVMPEGNTVLYAVWEIDQYTVELPASAEGYSVFYDGTKVTAPKSVLTDNGAKVSFEVVIAEGFSPKNMNVVFGNVALGYISLSGNTYTYETPIITSDGVIEVRGVEEITFPITLNKGTGFTVSPTNQIVSYNKTLEFKVTLDDAYALTAPTVYVDGNSITGVKNGNEYTYTANNIISQPMISVSATKNPQHTAIFVSGGSVYTFSTVEHQSRLTEPAAPERAGYTFGGWYTEKECTNKYNFETSVTDDVVLYAKWIANTYNVSYDLNGALGTAPLVQTKTHDVTLKLSESTPERNGYSFKGWNTEANGLGTPYGAGSEYIANASATLYAQWEKNVYTITLIKDTGVNAQISANTAKHGDTVTLTVSAQDNYKNPVISANPASNATLVSGTTYTITGPVSFSVTATPKTVYTYTFNAEGKLHYSQSAIEGSGDTVVLPTEPSKEGYTFKGWYIGNTQVTETTVIDSDKTVVAQWTINEYEVTPAANGDGYQVTTNEADNKVNYEDSYRFKVTIANGYNAEDMRVYANGAILVPTVSGNTYSYTIENISEDVSVVVNGVKKNVYTVTYYVEGGIYYSEQVTHGEVTTAPVNAPVKLGESFASWQKNGADWNFADAIEENTALVAKFSANTVTVTPATDGEGYTVSTSETDNTVDYGGAYSFKVNILDHYNAKDMKVYANGILLIPEVSGNVYTYTVENVKVDTTVTVTDVKPDIYTVTFIADSETLHTEQVVYQNKATAPKKPVKAGYEFDCWTYNGVEWDFNTEIDVDIDLIAKFTPITYQVTLPQNTVGYTAIQTSSENPVTYDNEFTFDVVVDEAHNADNMRVYANGILLEATGENGSTVSFRIPNVKETTVITVKGIGTNTYAVNYKANTSEYVGNMPEGFIKTHDEDCVISDLTPERHGYNFLGWSVAADGSVDYDPTETYSGNSDLILYAVWEAKQFTVEFVTNGGTINGVGISEYTYGTGAILPDDVTFTGFDFAGWYEDELMQGVKVTEITSTDYGNKKYYAAYTIADVVANGYTGEYDGAYHLVDFSLTDALKVPVEKYQWYFIPEGTSTAIAVDSDSYNEYKVKDVAQNGEYYCYIETVLADSDISVHFLTNKATVTITKKPVTIKAEDASKVYDATALTTNTVLLADGSALVSEHTMSGVMTDVSTITNVGSQDNIIDAITVLDSEGKDVTDNYEITTQNGTLTITPATLSVVANNVSKSVNATLTENELYKISGQYGSEMLSLANVTITGKNQNNEDVALGDVTKNTGTYQMTINYDGFSGDGNENYTGTGTITSVVTVYRRSGGGSATPTYTVKYESNGGSDVESVNLTSGKVAREPEPPVKDGYTFEGWYTDKELTTAYDFDTKVTKSFTLYAKWTEIEKEPESTDTHNCPSKAFADLDTSAWYHLDIDYAIENGIFKGVTENTFAPNDKLTRAMLVTVLYRVEGEPATSRSIPFADVDMGAYYASAVSWAKQNGIVNGVTENEFAPDDNVTREQIAAIMMRYAVYKGIDTVTLEENLGFEDRGEISEYAVSAMNWAVGSGLINGKSATTLNPKDNATRAEIAAILHRFLKANK